MDSPLTSPHNFHVFVERSKVPQCLTLVQFESFIEESSLIVQYLASLGDYSRKLWLGHICVLLKHRHLEHSYAVHRCYLKQLLKHDTNWLAYWYSHYSNSKPRNADCRMVQCTGKRIKYISSTQDYAISTTIINIYLCKNETEKTNVKILRNLESRTCFQGYNFIS